MELKPMRVAGVAGLLFTLLAAGCGGVKPAPPGESPQTGSAQAGPATAAPVAPSVRPSSPPPPSAPAPTVATQGPTAAVGPAPAPAGQGTAKAGVPAAKAPAKGPAPPASAAQPSKNETVAPDTAKQKAAPPLDLTSLETRLKETSAIGVMTKIALKNQVDDLLNQFRAFYQGRLKTTLAELRRPYEMLLLKVLALLQDADPPLAGAIVASREAIWGILADPAKFATI
jgi:hypothetical protein